MESVLGSIGLDFAVPKILPVDARSSGTTSSPLSDPETEDRRLFARPPFLRALEAQSGVGFMRSNCLRNLRSYSRPPTVSSEGASRSLRRRLFEASETWTFTSSGSVHAGAFSFLGC
jgi:hypothetical protein